MNYDVSLLEIKLFLMTNQFGNFSEVARRQDMTPSSVSRKMAQLENKVGSKLLHRHTRAISLTEEGVVFVKHCTEIIRQYELVAEQIEQKADSPRGTIKISAPVAFGRLHIAPYIPELLDKYPLLKVEIHQTDSFVDPAQESIDLLIRIGVLQNSSMRMKRFGVQQYVMAASPEYIKLHGMPETAEQLEGHNCLVFKGTKGLQRWFIGKEELAPFDVTGSLYSNNAETLVSSAVGGAGIVMFPTWLIGEELKIGKLLPIMIDHKVSTTSETQTINALYLETDNLAPKVRVVIDFLTKKYGTPCYWDAV
ncbi:LysR family transcriptional regulator [Pseudoalteromonas sp. SG43-3]|uniref:LysR family transcriptional regulator n=1 Tax=Pseudoalteromonas sp. SG43-3 TaxID=2760970 RepID=UPI0016035776|nr:LysR family transcriptional regulator [Pseudoalteromonas sp. SG43-3]MBB1442378.1 LysR family transcriptional regulator [Pseudoalteromonas sp. SG43-3]|tara:strand:- start:1183 stop:2106 length:924 start_codon:yes stop_codon:yes gene_type:complete